MGGKSVLIVPATVPGAVVKRVRQAEPEGPSVVSAEPALVPVARVQPLIPEQLTAEQAAVLREENAQLREELERVRSLD